jgi:hypothetical protein
MEGKLRVRSNLEHGRTNNVYSVAYAQAAQAEMARFLGMPESSIIIHYLEASAIEQSRSLIASTPVTPAATRT